MRNLKRALSLALASVMLLGMMVVGTSAASYPDVDSNDNVEAIEVLNAVKVMIGDRGNFKPDAKVNRHEMAVIMAKLVLGNDTADNYVGTHPFTDVASWADKYVAACYENGIAAGTSKTTFGGDQPLTAVEAAAFMLRALGYKDLSKGASDWSVPVTAMANQIRLFNGVASNPKEQLDRNQVAQLALNTLKSPVVDLKDGTFTATDGNGQLIISGGSREYIARSSSEDYAKAINSTEVAGTSASQIGGCTIELGEHLYNGKLKLNNEDTDDFGRPARTWTYDGDKVGSYAKTELLVDSYILGVTGRQVYDKLGQSAIRESDLEVYLDGADNTANVTKQQLVRSNEDDLNGTGRGVLTEIYRDSNKKEITIVSINTFLAQANNDYNANTETVSLTVYNNATGTTKLVDKEDVPSIVNLKKNDWVLVNWADPTANKTVVNMMDTEIKENVEVTAFNSSNEYKDNLGVTSGRRVTEITTGGETYKNNKQAWYKWNTLNDYDDNRLVDKTYTVYMDQYGNFIGAELYSGKDQYVFITGYDRPTSAIGVSTANASAIFTDGTMKAIKVNVTDTNKKITAADTGYTDWAGKKNHEEMWYTYTVSGDVYTLTPVTRWTRHVAPAGDASIQSNRVRLVPATLAAPADTYNGTGNSYGEDASVYITVKMGDVDESGRNFQNITDTKGITEIGGVYTGVQNVKLVYTAGNWAHSVYSADGNYIIAAIVLGEAEGIADNYAFIRDGAYNERVEKESDGSYTHYWKVDVIMDGKLDTKTIKSKFTGTVNELVPKTVQELVMDADGYVTKINTLPNSVYMSGTTATEAADDSALLATVDQNKDKVYSNYDYKTNTRSSKPNSADLIDYSVYDINVGSNDYTWAAGRIGTTAAPWDSTGTYTYTNLSVQGRTIVLSGAGADFGGVANDVGLPYVADAKAVVYQQVGNKMKYVDYDSVEAAFTAIYDAAPTVANGENMKQFSGRIVAALDSDGRAAWVFFYDYTPAPNSDPIYTEDITGEKLSYNAPLAEVNKLLAEGKNVIIDGTWLPYDLSATNRTLRLPRGRTLTVLGDFNTYKNNGSDTIAITQVGNDSKLGKIIVGQSTGTSEVTGATFTIMQDVDFNIQAQNMVVDHLTLANGTVTFRAGTEVKVNRNLALRNSMELDAYGTLTVDGDVVKGAYAVSPKVNVRGTTTIGGNLYTDGYVYNPSTLIVKGSVGNGTDAVTVYVGNGTGNGRAVIGTVAANASVIVNNTTASTAASTVTTNNGTVTVTSGSATVTTNAGTATGTPATLNVTSVTGGTVTGATVTNMTGGTIQSGTVVNIGKDASINVTGTDKVTVTGTLDTAKVVVSANGLILKAGATIGANSNVKVGAGTDAVTGSVKNDIVITGAVTQGNPVVIPAGNAEDITATAKSPTKGQPTNPTEASDLAVAMPSLGQYITLGLTEEYTPNASATESAPKGTIKLVGDVTPIAVKAGCLSEAAMTEYAPGDETEIAAGLKRGWENGDGTTHHSEGFKSLYFDKLEAKNLKVTAIGFVVVNVGGDDWEAMVARTEGADGWKAVKRNKSTGEVTLIDSIDVGFASGKYTIDYTGLK